MYPTHTLLAQVAADRTADGERRARAGRKRGVLGSRRRQDIATPHTVAADVRHARANVRPSAMPLTRPRRQTV
jgi:hypothetical protein